MTKKFITSDETLRENRVFFERSQEAAHIGSWTMGPEDNDPLVWSKENYRIFGLDEKTFENKTAAFFSRVHPDDHKKVRRAAEAAFAGKKPYNIEHRIVLPNSSVRWVWQRGEVVRDAKGGGVKMIGICQDITTRVMVEKWMKESENRFRQMTENIHEVFWMTNVEKNQMIYISPGYEQIWGRSCESLYASPQSWVEAIHPGDRERVLQAAITRQLDGTYDEEYRILRPDGAMRWVRDRAFPIKDENGRVTRVTGIADDITDRKKTEEMLKESQEQLRQAQKMDAVGRLAGGVAHDFNNLLTAIMGYSDFLLKNMAQDAPERADIEEIRNAGLRAVSLTRQLLAFSRKLMMTPKVLNLNQVVSGLEPMLRRLINENIGIETRLYPDLAFVKADSGQIEQAIMNLVINSRDAMPRGGEIIIETSNIDLQNVQDPHRLGAKPGPHVMLSISDTGQGMDQETLSHLFEPFFTTKGRGHGTGLGLATAYGIIKQSGGNIEVDSELEIGTTFKLYFPRTDEPLSLQEPMDAATQFPSGSGTVLIVEDEDMVRNLACRILKSCGYTVFDAPSGENAMKVCAGLKQPIDLLLTDVVLPQMTGGEAAKRVTALFPRIRVIYMSGYADDVIVHHGIVDPGVALIQKPFSAKTLTDAVHEAFRKPQSINS